MQVKRSSMLPGNGRSLSELSGLPTVELVKLAQSGEREAFDPLYRRFGARVLANAVRRCEGDRDRAEDLASEVWATALVWVKQWEPRGEDDEEGFVRWLFGITKRELAWRFADQREIAMAPEGEWESVGPLVGQPVGEVCENPAVDELRAQMRAAVEGLSARQREVVGLYLEGLPCAEVAVKTGLSGAKVAATWTTATAALRARLADPIDTADPEVLRSATRGLTEVQRRVALLCLDGLDVGEVAARTGLTRRRVHDAWRRAKDGLRRALAQGTTETLTDELAARRQRAKDSKRAELRAAALTLPPSQRRVALLRLDGKRYREIAAVLGSTPTAAESSWRAARAAFVRQGYMPAAA